MGIGLLGKKIGCTQVYLQTGEVVPVTVIQAGPCTVLQVKSVANDGYESVQVGYKDKLRRRAIRSERGHVAELDSKRRKARLAAGEELLAKAQCEPQQFIREFRLSTDGFAVGQQITVDVFEDVISVDVTATSKGCGYSGVMKRHNFSGQRATHGVKKCHRHLGSTGCSAYPSRTMKGKKMPGQYGSDRVTVRNQKVVMVDKANNLILVRGAVPGPNGGLVMIKPTGKLPAPKKNRWRIAVPSTEVLATEVKGE